MLNTHFFPIAWLLAILNYVAAAQESRSCDGLQAIIYNQSDLDFYSNCTDIEYFLSPDHTFSGPFDLPGVKTVGQFAAGYLGPELKGDNRTADGVTSISMPDLEATTMKSLVMGYLSNLTEVSFPKLNSVDGELAVIGNDKLKILSLPSLVSVTFEVYLDGEFDEIHLPMLKNIAWFKVTTLGKLDCRALGANLSSVTFHPSASDLGNSGFSCTSELNSYSFGTSSDSTQSSTSSVSSSPSSTVASSTVPSSASISSTSASPSTSSTKSSRASETLYLSISSILLYPIIATLLELLWI